MTDSCKQSPNGRHFADSVYDRCCRYCHRTVDYLRDMGWNVPALDPDAHDTSALPVSLWQDEEADINDAASRWATRVMDDATKP